MGDVTFEIILIFLLLLLNGLFSMSEMAVVSARKARLQQRATSGDKGARAALELASNPGAFLSTVQIGITLVGILAGAFGGATLSENISGYLKTWPKLEPYADNISFGLVVLVITYFSLVIGELIPKRLALHSPDRIASIAAAPMKKLSALCSPVVRLLEASTEGLLHLFGLRESADPPVTEDEIKVLIEQGIQAGVFQEEERDVIERVFHLGDLTASDLMVPRPDAVWLDINDSPEEIRQKISSRHFSRFPVIDDTPDNVLGIVRTKDLLARELDEQPFDLRAVMLKPLFVPESMPAFKVIETFRQARRHLAVVIDEHGGVEGIVTVNDVLDSLVGDLPSMDDPAESPVVLREDGSLLLDGWLSVNELKKALQLKHLPGETEGHYQTLGGFVMKQLGKLPVTGDHFEFQGWRLEVLDMDRNRVDKVLAAPLPRL